MKLGHTLKSTTGSGLQLGSPGFTRTEALTLILVTTVLACLQLPLRGDARRVSRAAVCVAGMRQLQLGWTLYAADHDGRIVAAGNGPVYPTWSPGWAPGSIDYSSQSANKTPEVFPGPSPLIEYCGNDAATYHCPSDPVLLFVRVESSAASRRLPRTRSRSLNCWVGGPESFLSAPWRYAASIHQLMDPGPARTLTFIDEREDSINDGRFDIDMSGFPTTRGTAPRRELNRIIDYPAYWHRGGAGVAFADGHVSVHRWDDTRTTPSPRGSRVTQPIASPHNADVTWLQEHSPRLSM